MSAPSPPPDNSMQIRQMELDEARRKEEAQAAKDAQHKAELTNLRSNARTSAGAQANSYFSGQGVDASQYTGDINSYLDSVMAGINPTDENPASYFKDAGQTVYNQVESGRRTKAQTDLDRIFSPNFETKRIPFTLDDPYLASIEAEQRASADSIIKNMLDRGVITSTGYATAAADLDKQSAGVKTRLNELGTTTIASGQQKLKDISNTAHQEAGQLKLGGTFDPYSYSSDADRVFDEFIGSLGDTIRSKVTGNLFNTTGLAALAGSGQGAQNTAFNPQAAAGILQDTDAKTDDDSTKESIF